MPGVGHLGEGIRVVLSRSALFIWASTELTRNTMSTGRCGQERPPSISLGAFEGWRDNAPGAISLGSLHCWPPAPPQLGRLPFNPRSSGEQRPCHTVLSGCGVIRKDRFEASSLVSPKKPLAAEGSRFNILKGFLRYVKPVLSVYED